ncbi:MAG TPA: DHA2 family efflux MFS transporter permease subunit [Minicystis sp.]|nr:DHA2 family efflux MFS transporter permease subunit [Minicystis sp.]
MTTASVEMAPRESAPEAVNKWLVAVAVALGALLEVVDTSIVNVALTDMQNSLGATLSEVSWVVSSYAVANVIILPLTAWLGDKFGKKRYFVFSLIAFTGASVLCGMSTNLTTLIIARVLQGLGGGGLLAKAQAILFETFPREEQAMAQGFFGAIVIAGPTIGPTLGGYITTNIDWRWIFFVNVPVGIAAVMMCLAFLPADDPKHLDRGGVDWIAIALLAIGLGSLQTVLEEGETEDWFSSSFIVTFFVAAILGLVFFVVRTLRAKHPVVDLRVLRYRSVWAGSVLSIVIGIGLYGTMFAVPIYAQSILHLTAQQTGIVMLPGALTSAFMMPIVARLTRWLDARVLLCVGGVILMIALLELGKMSPQTGEDDFFLPLIIRAGGTTCMFLPLSLATIGPVPKKDISSASGIYNLTRQLGGSIGVALLATILESRQAFHRAVLVEKVGRGDPHVFERLRMMASAFVAKGADVASAKARALALLDGAVNLQAAVMSFNDTFYVTMALVLLTMPLVLLLGKGAGKVEMGH